MIRIKVGCDLHFECPQPTPMIVMLNVHYSRVSDLEGPDHVITRPRVPLEGYRDSFGNWCYRFVAPAGHFEISTDAVVRDSGEWDAVGWLDPAAYAPCPGPLDPEVLAGAASRQRSLPVSLGLGAMLLDQAGYGGRRRLLAAAQDEPASACAALGASLNSASASALAFASASSAPASSGRTALLVMGDGSARRSLKAPGYLDPRAAAFDAEVERAIRAGDLGALLRLDQALARDLMATGRPAWQVLAGAMRELALVVEVLYCGDPFGVAYLVACLRPRRPADHR